MQVGERIKQLREQAGLSLRGLAASLHLNPSYLSRIEAGKVPPSEDLLVALARALPVELDELMLLAGRVPSTWKEVIASAPERAVERIRTALDHCVGESLTAYGRQVLAFQGTRAIEDPAFPFEQLSEIAELESWRKELNRPIYHLHKWWAQRLGSVFRAILLGAFAPKGSDLLEMFYQPARLPGAVIFDPFMGSGTTVGEALKLGARAIGRDLNPVAHFAVRNALAVHSRRKVLATFQEIAADLAPTLRQYYQARWPQEGSVEVLYYFWVKTVPCPGCRFSVDLFSTRIFTRHADSQRHPEARSVCPHCGAIETVHYADHTVCCSVCQNEYAPQEGPARGAQAHCPVCGHTFPMAKTIKASGRPPDHRLYAKMVLLPDGHKEYLPTDDYDRALYEEAGQSLARRAEAYPVVPIAPGYNTNQLLNYGYTHWHQLFNDRQLLCLSLLAERIRAIPEENLRALFACLFSGCLEFNNMLASYKGEGTGAVRHAFAHHILKPERTPLEANLWGTPKSSGAFSTLFQSRLLRALDYAEEPFELRVIRRNGRPAGEKVYGLNVPLGHDIADTFAAFQEGKLLYLSCGDSAQTDLADASVDAVITDPPFFDNVHYSELADFFFVWQRHLLGPNGDHVPLTTRSPAEVQQRDAETFTDRLSGVWTECHRVLRPGGLLIFTYHHSRSEGWQSVLKALVTAGWVITAAHPVKAEMSVAAPKQQAAEPIDLDVILVCRRRLDVSESLSDLASVIDESSRVAEHQIARFNRLGRALSRNDVRVILTAQVIARLSRCPDLTETVPFLEARQTAIEREIDRLHHAQSVAPDEVEVEGRQLRLF